jgi:V8-like Glu-specific endopeptidase
MFSITATDADKSEDDSGIKPFTFTVTRTGPLAAPASVDWVVTGSGPNPAGKDFAGVLQNSAIPVYPRGTVTFAAGKDTAVITVRVLGDLGQEPDEGFTVTLNNPSPGTPIAVASASGVIRNDGILGFFDDVGVDDRTSIVTATAVVAVDALFPGGVAFGSGILISPIHVLTAGHVLSNGRNRAVGAGVTPSSAVNPTAPRFTYGIGSTSVNQGNFLGSFPAPDNAASATFFPFSYPASGVPRDDLALQRITSVGATNADVLPIAVFYDVAMVNGRVIATAGYPALYSDGSFDGRLDPNNGSTLYIASGAVSDTKDEGSGRARIYYSKTVDTQAGQSGSGVWTNAVEGQAGSFLIAIHNYGGTLSAGNTFKITGAGQAASNGSLITKDAYVLISQRMEADYGPNSQAEAASLPENVLVGSNPGFFSFLGFSTGGDYIEGSFRRERLVGLGGDDRMHGGDGDDRYEGGAGVDQALFRDVLGNYTISVTNAGAASFQIEHTSGDRKSGKDAIKETEFAVFEFVDANRDGADDDGNLLYVPLQVDPKDPTKLKDGPAIKPTTTVRDAQNTDIGSFTADLPAWSFDGDVRYSFTIGPKQGTLFNVALIQDVSGSMSGAPLTQSKAAYQALIQSFIDRGIADKSKFAVIPFNSSSQLFAPLTASQALSRINSLSAGGGTAFGPPLSSAAQFFTANPGPTNLAYFVSDGFGSGASTSLQSLANVQAFGLPGADTSGLNIIDTDNAVILNNPSDIVTALNTVTIDRSTIDRIEVKLDGTVVSTIAPGQLIDQGAGGFRFEGDLSGLDVSRSANNKIEFVLVFNNGTPSVTLQSAITTGQTEIVQQTNNGASVVVTFAVNQANYTPNVGPAQSLVITANDLSNTITTGPAQNNIESFGGDDRIIITPGSSGVVDGGDGIDTAVFGVTRATAGTISTVGNIVQVGSYNFTNVEFLDFTDVRLATATLQSVPVVTLPVTSITVQEGADIVGRTATFTVALGTTATSPVTVGIAIAGGSATADDFSSLPNSVTIAAGQTTASFSVVVNDDALAEGDEAITLALSLAGDAQFGDGSQTALAGVLVADDDTSLEVPIAGFNRVLEGDPAAPGNLSLTMIRSGNLDGSFDVAYSVTPSGANPVDAADFAGNLLPSGMIRFNAGQSTAQILIPISGDLDNEQNESFTINFSLSGANIAAPEAAEYIIANDDGLSPTNKPPTALNLLNAFISLAENSSTAKRIKVADIVISDDALGTNTITLSGADAVSFEVDGFELFLKAGINLDFEAKSSYVFTVTAIDPTLSGSTPVTAALALAIADVNELLGNASTTTAGSITLPSGEIRSIPVNINIPDFSAGSYLAVNSSLDINPAGLSTLAEFGVTRGATGLDFQLAINPGATASLSAVLDLVATDLLPQLIDPSGRRPDRKLLFYGVTGSGALLPLTYDPITGAGGRFYDLDNNGTADFFALSLIDGGFGDKDGLQNGIIEDPSFAGFADLSNLRFSNTSPGTVTVSDPGNAAPAAVNLRASLSGRPDSSNQIGYVVLNASEVARADSLLSDLNWLRGRARTLVSTLESTDVTLPASGAFDRDLLLINGQSLRFFEVVDASLDRLSSLSDSRFRLLNPSTITNGQVAYNSSSGASFSLSFLPSDPGLNALISHAQGIAPVLDLSAFTAAQSLSGSVALGREADYDSSVGLYRTLDITGLVIAADGITRLRPGDSGYAAAALRPANLVSELNGLTVADDQTATRSFSGVSGGSFLAPFALVNGETYFAFGEANRDGLAHLRSLGNNTFGLEDLPGGGDLDFDDLVVKFDFATVV